MRIKLVSSSSSSSNVPTVPAAAATVPAAATVTSTSAAAATTAAQAASQQQHVSPQAEDANIVFQPAVSADESGLLCSSGDNNNVVDPGNGSDMSLVASLVVDENQASQQ
jgi:hypothetical protein